MTSYQHSKNIIFFGDSWYWNWYGPGLYDYEISSTTLKNSSFYHINSQKIGSIGLYIKEFGYTPVVYNDSGSTFYTNAQKILSSKPQSNTIVNVLFFSSLIRRVNYKIFPIHDFNASMQKIKEDTIKLLKQLFIWAEENKTYLMIVGGQSPLPLETFKAAGHSDYVYLMAECLPAAIASIVYKKHIDPFGMFRLACFTEFLDERWDKEFIDVIYKDTKNYRHSPYIKLLTFPDYWHLNSLSSFAFVDMLFNKLENLQLLK